MGNVSCDDVELSGRYAVAWHEVLNVGDTTIVYLPQDNARQENRTVRTPTAFRRVHIPSAGRS